MCAAPGVQSPQYIRTYKSIVVSPTPRNHVDFDAVQSEATFSHRPLRLLTVQHPNTHHVCSRLWLYLLTTYMNILYHLQTFIHIRFNCAPPMPMRGTPNVMGVPRPQLEARSSRGERTRGGLAHRARQTLMCPVQPRALGARLALILTKSTPRLNAKSTISA